MPHTDRILQFGSAVTIHSLCFHNRARSKTRLPPCGGRSNKEVRGIFKLLIPDFEYSAWKVYSLIGATCAPGRDTRYRSLCYRILTLQTSAEQTDQGTNSARKIPSPPAANQARTQGADAVLFSVQASFSKAFCYRMLSSPATERNAA